MCRLNGISINKNSAAFDADCNSLDLFEALWNTDLINFTSFRNMSQQKLFLLACFFL